MPISNIYKNIVKLGFVVFFFLMPFQIRTLVYAPNLYDGGFFDPYTSVFIYLNDIVLLTTLFVLALLLIFKPKGFGKFSIGNFWVFTLFVFLCLSAFASALYAQNPYVSIFYAVRLCEFLIIYLVVVNKVISLDLIMKSFIFSMMISSFIGIFQYVFQSSLGFGFLGEPVLSAAMKGIAKVDIGDNSILRAYGTFSHPNLFAGYLIFAIFFALYQFIKIKNSGLKVLFISCMIVFGLAFLVAFSRTAFLALFAAFVVFYIVSDKKIVWKYLIPVLACLILFIVSFEYLDVFKSRIDLSSDSALTEREMFIKISKKMFLAKPWGVGASNFTYSEQDYSSEKLMPWLKQPVHNTYFLMFNEQGIYGGILYVFFILYILLALSKSLKEESDKDLKYLLIALWMPVFLVGFLDHYYVSLYSGQLLFYLFVAFAGTVSVKKVL
ncbi:MAG: O-antigen ligase family protein [Candidatus Gracilibacteria bacterium]|jgi:O-antigen ligase